MAHSAALKRLFQGLLAKSFWFQALLCLLTDMTSNFFLLAMQVTGGFSLEQLSLALAGKYAVAALIAVIVQLLPEKMVRRFVVSMLTLTAIVIGYLAFIGAGTFGLVLASVVIGTIWSVRGLQFSLTLADAMNKGNQQESQAGLALVLTFIPVLSSVTLFIAGFAADKSTSLFFMLVVLVILMVIGFFWVFKPELPARIQVDLKMPRPLKALVALGIAQNISHYVLVYLVVPLTIYAYSSSMKAVGTFVGIMVFAGLFASSQAESDKATVRNWLLAVLGVATACWVGFELTQYGHFTLASQMLIGGYGLLFIMQMLSGRLAAVVTNPRGVVATGILGMAVVRVIWGGVDILFFDGSSQHGWIVVFFMAAFSLHLVFARFWSFGFTSRIYEIEPTDHDKRKAYLKAYVSLDFVSGIIGALVVALVAHFASGDIKSLTGPLIFGAGLWLLVVYAIYRVLANSK